MARAKRLRVGDIIQIRMSTGYAYAQCVLRDPVCGHLIRVFPGIYKSPLSKFSVLVEGPEEYHTFLLWGSNVDPSLISIAEHCEVPQSKDGYPMFKAGVVDPATGKVATWWLWDGKKEWKVGTLTEEQRQYSLREIWNDILLVERLESGWRPTDQE